MRPSIEAQSWEGASAASHQPTCYMQCLQSRGMPVLQKGVAYDRFWRVCLQFPSQSSKADLGAEPEASTSEEGTPQSEGAEIMLIWHMPSRGGNAARLGIHHIHDLRLQVGSCSTSSDGHLTYLVKMLCFKGTPFSKGQGSVCP